MTGKDIPMKTRQKRISAAALLTLAALAGGCSTAPGRSFFKTPTEQAIVSLSLGDYENAANSSEKALKKNASDPYALMVAGIAYENLGFPNKSRRFYEDVVALNGSETGVFNVFKNIPAQTLGKTASDRLVMMEQKKHPIAAYDPTMQAAVFTEEAFPGGVRVTAVSTPKVTEVVVKGGLDMLSEGDRNVVQRFLTFMQLRDEQLATAEEFEQRRAANLGGLLPYTLAPAGLGLNQSVPPAQAIIGRLNALKDALEMRAITPREHAAEREIILDALLPANPRRRMEPLPPPKGMLDGATALRRIEMLKNMGLISSREAEEEKEAIERLVYMRLGMTDGNKGIDAKAASACIRKCLTTPKVVCPQVPAPKPAVKKKAVKRKAPVKKPALCPCPAS